MSSSGSFSDFDMDTGDVNEGVEIRVQSSVQQSVKRLQEIADEDPPEFGIDEDNMEDWEDDSKAPSIYRQDSLRKTPVQKKPSSRFYHLLDDPPKKKSNFDVQRFYKHQEKVNEKIKTLSKVVEEKEVEECTFKPTILTKSRTRTVPEFLKQVEKDKELREERIKVKLEERENDLQAMKSRANPKLCKNSLRIVGKNGENGIEKLAKAKTYTKPPEKLGSFKPTVNLRSQEMVREKSIEVHLYEDALRRSSKTPVEQPTQSFKLTSTNSEKVLLQKFSREFEEMFEYLDPERTLSLSYTKFTTLLFNLGFISKTSTHVSQLKQLAVELWNLLEGSSTGFVTYNNVKALLTCVMNYKDSSIKSHSFPPGLGRMIDGEFCVTQGEALKIHRHFFLLHQEKTTPPGGESLNSSFRSESLNDSRRKLDTKHEDMLISEKARLQEKWETIRQKNVAEEISKCTFKPKIKRGPRTIASSSDLNDSTVSHYSFYSETKSQSQKRNDILYEYAKIFNQQRHNTTKNHIDLDSSAELKGCTFKPSIAKRIRPVDAPEVKGVKEIISRLRNARNNRPSMSSDKPFVFNLEANTSRMSIDLNSSVSSKNLDVNRSFSSESDKVSVKVNLPNGKRTVFQINQHEDKSTAIKKFVQKHSLKGEAERLLREQLKGY